MSCFDSHRERQRPPCLDDFWHERGVAGMVIDVLEVWCEVYVRSS